MTTLPAITLGGRNDEKSKNATIVLDFLCEIHKRTEQLARSDHRHDDCDHDHDDSKDPYPVNHPDRMDNDVDMVIHNQHHDNNNNSNSNNKKQTVISAVVTSSSSTSSSLSPDVYIEKITHNLLRSCHPSVLALDVSHLPELNPFYLDEATRKRYNNTIENDDDNDDDMETDYYTRKNHPDRTSQHRPYQHRRTDYLRRLLRVMAPITMEVGASVCSTVLSTIRRSSNPDVTTSSSTSSSSSSLTQPSTSLLSVPDQQLVIASIILFAHWLPVAPQLVPMVTEFFERIPTLLWAYGGSTTSTSTSSSSSSFHRNKIPSPSEVNFIVAEALHTLCYFFYRRNEISTLTRLSWDWTFVFGMLHSSSSTDDNNDNDHDDDDTVMKEDRTGLLSTSMSRNRRPFALHTAIQWYALRTLSMIMNWCPQTIASVVEKWQLFEVDDSTTTDDDGGERRHTNRLVPSWQIHPWEINQEELEMEDFHFKQQVTIWRVSPITTINSNSTVTTTPNTNVQTSPNNGDVSIDFPSADDVQDILLPSPYLVRVGRGVCFYQQGSLARIGVDNPTKPSRRRDSDDDNNGDMDVDLMEHGSTASHRLTTPAMAPRLVVTVTTVRNLSLLGAALCEDPYPPPILVCGPHGSGKSSLVRELCRMCRPNDSLMEFHIDDETDYKTLVGSYSTTDIPGEFAWRPGALTHASREGRWILLEDYDSVPIEIQAGLVKLLEERMLHLGNGRYERSHPNFRIFATCTTTAGTSSNLDQQKRSLRIGNHRRGGKQILNPSYWRNIHVKPLPYSELREVATSMFGSLPESVIDSSLTLMKYVDRSGRTGTSVGADRSEGRGVGQSDVGSMDVDHFLNQFQQSTKMMWFSGRLPSVRDFFKLLSRISNGMCFEKNVAYLTEAQRTLCMVESVETFLGSCSDQNVKEEFLCSLAAPVWGIAKGLALDYIEKRKPTIFSGPSGFQIGRAKIELAKSIGFTHGSYSTFAETNQSLRLMESIAVCVRENEPVLLVGETGCGKTTVIQQLATYCDKKLAVQNLSLQTDSTDLLGGYRPLEIRNAARHVYEDFVDTFVATFSRKQNLKFLEFAASMLAKSDWKKLSQCFQRAAQLGAKKMTDLQGKADALASEKAIESWKRFARNADRFERQRTSCDAGIAFEFAEGALVDALRTGKWILLDEINLATSDTLQRLCGLLDEPTGSITLTERGDATSIKRHPDFRLFAAMNPSTDAGKKDLPASIRCRFSELYVEELLDRLELRVVAARYMDGVLPIEGHAAEHTEIVVSTVDLYLRCRDLAETTLCDGNGHKPRYTLRTLSRALSAARSLILQQRIRLHRAVFEGFQLAFEGVLDPPSAKILRKDLTRTLLDDQVKVTDLDHPGKRPGGKNGANDYVLLKPFWIKAGPLETADWSETGADGKSKFILTPSVQANLRRLSRALVAGPWPILLEGPTSSGKTTLVEYTAARCGYHVVRINNHEHTDVQEYTGSFAADPDGGLSFRDGILVQALRKGHWVILDELNLAPSEVLEALNRLLDDNRELYIPETNETIKPHPSFRLFATQNPSGAYGGRKPLSRAFRNRFVELHVGDLPSNEMTTILEKRCGCPPSHAKVLVSVMVDLRQRRSKSNVFLGKDSFITPRDLLRWAERQSGSKQQLAQHGYMLLAERLRSEEEKRLVRDVLEEHLKVTIDLDHVYYSEDSEANVFLRKALEQAIKRGNGLVMSIAPTRSLLRLIQLVLSCIRQKEPVLLVGETGCGKTTVVQLLSFVLDQELHSVNCHATTETSDLLGGLRPVRGRDWIRREILTKLNDLAQISLCRSVLEGLNSECYFSDGSSVLDLCDVDEMIAIARTILARTSSDTVNEAQMNKRRKMTASGSPNGGDHEIEAEALLSVEVIVAEIEELGKRHNSLFEWSDGPLVKAMKSGQMLLLDEMSLAEDAVLERLNSVLEPSRQLVLAEKGDDGTAGTEKDDRIIIAHEDFRIFATMNPGGDFGKRELSPALRSRFTEIWVPSITRRSDFEIVVGRTLSLSSNHDGSSENSSLLGPILQYVEWFNHEVCGEVSSPFFGYALSLRDILSWAHFVVESRNANDAIPIWDAFFHGACLMHLDGLGLGSGLAPETSIEVKRKAEEFLLRLVSHRSVSNVHSVTQAFGVKGSSFGAFPYFIDVGSCEISDSSKFNLAAPTTSLNTFRVLRAMQLKKPILLEGSPGVGKTSLINAIAKASGHKLVRINLSEQTDISDLMGSDLPVESPGKNEPAFEWRDGVLLTAIKEGSWVLLDELNLASQAVLEGLNSCLDHRSTVYIPELGRTFVCPQTFRVFAAQNPLGQGGGRKGLPKSFLNRFTKVFVDALNDLDLRSIVTARFPSLRKECVDQMIDFNNEIHREVVELREFGSDGGPWEFNLRDVFRWSELLQSTGCSHAGCGRDLYYQRFRNQDDRERVDKIFQKHFGCSLKSPSPPKLEISNGAVTIGESTLIRGSRGSEIGHGSPAKVHHFLLNQLLPMEATARCINQRWPVLLVGGNGTGKTAVVSMLAELCNNTLVELCLSPSSDVSELIGGFEQVESTAEDTHVLTNILRLADVVLVDSALDSSDSRRCLEWVAQLKTHLANLNDSAFVFEKPDGPPWRIAESLTNLLYSMIQENPLSVELADRIKSMRDTVKAKLRKLNGTEKSDEASHFFWRDGILVEAMTKGYWLVLENVNLCPASVLDRLNSVTESDGFLLLSESGTQDGDCLGGSHRLIRPHPDFRIFLTMDQGNGEVSRAMRNRCVEIALLKSRVLSPLEGYVPAVPKTDIVDFLCFLQENGVRSFQLASSILENFSSEHSESSISFGVTPCARRSFSSVKMMVGLLSRGIDVGVAVQNFLQFSYELHEETLVGTPILDRSHPQMASPMPLRLSLGPEMARDVSTIRASLEGSLLAAFSGLPSDAHDVITMLGFLKNEDQDPVEYKVLDVVVESNTTFFELQCRLAQLYLCGKSAMDFEAKVSVFDGLQSSVAFAVRWMASTLRHTYGFPALKPLLFQSKSVELSPVSHNWSASSMVALSRIKQDFVENEWTSSSLQTGSALDSHSQLTVLEASFFIHENFLDRSAVSCTITRLIFPFFLALDEWTMSILRNHEAISEPGLGQLRNLFDERDRMWELLRDLRVESKEDSFAAFDETEFIVQWDRLSLCMSETAMDCNPRNGSWNKAQILGQTIEATIFGGTRPAWYVHSVGRKTIRPVVPRRSKQWDAIVGLKGLDKACSLASDQRFDPFETEVHPIGLGELMSVGHPSLYIPHDQKIQLLAALCTTQSTYFRDDDVLGVEGKNWIDDIDFPKRVAASVDQMKQAFDMEIAVAKVDHDIETSENQICAEDLEELRDSSPVARSMADTYIRLRGRLLDHFARIQLSPMAEFWCVHKEISISGQICQILLDYEDEESVVSRLATVIPDVKILVDVAISLTIWEAGDMCPFQTMIWAFEGKGKEIVSFQSLLRSLLPTILATISRHSFTSSFVCDNAVSKSLELPGMWNADIQLTSTIGRVSTQEEPSIGTARLRHPFWSDMLLNTIGPHMSFSRDAFNVKFLTMENGISRERHFHEMLKTVSSLSFSVTKDRLKTYNFLFFDILKAVRDVFRDSSMDEIVDLVKDPKIMVSSNIDHIRRAGEKVSNEVFNLYWSDLLFPLTRSLCIAWQEDIHSQEFAKQRALASVYLGLTRLNLLTPDSPLDPGRAALGEVSVITRRLKDISSSVTAARLNSGFVDGDFAPRSEYVMALLGDAELLVRKRASTQKKVVQRMESAPPFHELYSATRDFLTFTSGNSAVLELLHLIRDNELGKGDFEVCRRRVENWQRTAAAFCKRLSSYFDAYEDITTGIVDSVRMIQDGLFDRLVINAEKGEFSADRTPVLCQLLRYPMREDSEFINNLLEQAGRMIRTSTQYAIEGNTSFSNWLSIALLARLRLKNVTVLLKDDELVTCSLLLEGLSTACKRFPTGGNEGKSLEEIQELIYREQFPDHREEFESILRDKNDDMEGVDEESGENPHDEPHDEQQSNVALSDKQIELLYRLAKGIFLGTDLLQIDSLRKITLHASYAAAYELKNSMGGRCLKNIDSEPIGCHVFAMSSLSTPKSGTVKLQSYLYENGNVVDFQNEACPTVAMTAAAPLERLMARTTQLLAAFPGHSILIGLGRVCEKVNKLDLTSTPIGKVMTGFEVILRQAQDWEQHASDRVKLGSSLVEIARLISDWRKLELECWGKLIEARQNRHARKARRHWLRLRGVLVANTDEDDDLKSQTRISRSPTEQWHATPAWVWKGFSSIRSKLSDSLNSANPEELRELVKALDTFILTSPLGEFEERLTILRLCSNELMMVYKASVMKSTWTLQQSRVLYSIWKYYCQYRPVLDKQVEESRRPIEAKLKKETKLAKWDTQSYYALAESTERNHKKLMKILSEFDESMNHNVGMIVQAENRKGLRTNADAHDEFCATFPSTLLMFPIHESLNTTDSGKSCCQQDFKVKVELVSSRKLAGLSMDGHISRIPKYARKLQSFAAMREKNPRDSLARIGSEKASHFCKTIFERIESLREKSTRQMKERALFELFRELKDNGFTATKWSTPRELKEAQHLFILPAPSFELCGIISPDDSKLNAAEDYFMRCIAETNSLRSEVTMLGSKHMSTREMELMVNLSDSGMLMLTQQRCLLSKLSADNHDLEENASTMRLSNTSLPPFQSSLESRVDAFESRLKSAFESVRQVSLLINSVKHLMGEGTHTEWARDVVSKLELFSIEEPAERHYRTGFITWDKLETVDRNCKRLEKCELLLVEIRDECCKRSYLPLDIFDACLDDIRVAYKHGTHCKDVAIATIEKDTSQPLSNCEDFTVKLTSAIEQILLAYQGLSKEVTDMTQRTKAGAAVDEELDEIRTNPGAAVDEESDEIGIWECHKKFVRSCSVVDMKTLNQTLTGLIVALKRIHDDSSVPTGGRECCVGLASDTSVLLRYLQGLSHSLFDDFVRFYHSVAKLQFVVLRVFRVLVGKGFCSDENADGEGEGDANGMTFEDDNDGTGMGEGEGKKDVTDQIENEDQLAGLKSDKENEHDKPAQESKQLDEEEADKGMEMEDDFDGDMYDLPKKPEDENEIDGDEGEELERELGDSASPDEQVVDEKMWNDSDDEDAVNEDEEKFEKDSGVKGESIEDAVRTKDNEGEEGEKQFGQDEKASKENLPKESKDEGTGDTDGQDDQEEVNEDTDDRCEEQHGVEVRHDESQENVASDDQMQLDDNVDLDGENHPDPDDEEALESEEVQEENMSISEEQGEEQNDGSVCNPDDEQPHDEDIQNTSMNNAEVAMDIDKHDGEEPSDDAHDDGSDNEKDIPSKDPAFEEAHGIRSGSGTDAIIDEEQTDVGDENKEEASNNLGNPVEGTQSGEQAESDGHDGSGYSRKNSEPTNDSTTKKSSSEIPNPFKDPGDASKFWHRKLNVIDSDPSNSEEVDTEKDEDNDHEDRKHDKNGDFEYSVDQGNSTQVLGEAEEDQAIELDPIRQEEVNDDPELGSENKEVEDDKDERGDRNGEKQRSPPKRPRLSLDQRQADIEQNQDESVMEDFEESREAVSEGISDASGDESDNAGTETKIVSDLSKLGFKGDIEKPRSNTRIEHDELVTKISESQVNDARAEWLNIQGETQSLSRRLCEKLRLVMEPLVASKLRGDYRTGKRINMKRVIGYIASGYRKDKIWLRRTKPSKRDYRVLLAVDDSESMKKSGAGEMALLAMATVAVGMNQLEVGELGVASFGDDMKLVHPFHQPFTSESGVDIVRNFRFDQQRTRIAMCVESAMTALEEAGDRSSMQLVFLISDGRIERDSRSALKRLIREMVERNILLAMIIVEGSQKKKDSILNMKEVTFEKGKPVVKRFIEDYPFPYYIVLDEVSTLPEVLGDALKQWFEMLSQLQSSTK